jgi:rubrerythrin
MVTTVGTETNGRNLLRDLILLDYDAIAAYDVAIKGLSNDEYRRRLSAFRNDHVQHTRNLAPYLQQLGGDVPESGDMKELLTTGKVAMGSLLGDKAILQAMRSNEDDTNTAYARAVEHPDVTAELRGVLEQNLSDERRHCAWILQTLQRL